MKTKIIALIALAFSSTGFANTCYDLQQAEARIISAAFYERQQDIPGFCFFLSRAVSSTQGKRIGLDGLVQGGIELCVNSESRISIAAVAKETTTAMKSLKGCFSQIGQ